MSKDGSAHIILDYTQKGKKNGILIGGGSQGEAYNINELMDKEDDFQNEMTLLQFHASKLNVTLNYSPKCHSEITLKEIEYGWTFLKKA